jgi:5'(3')-deoxyribonucleotidase
MDKKIILVDLDDVLNPLVPSWLGLYNKDFSDNLKQEDIKSWDISSYVKPEAKDKFLNYLSQPNFFKQLDIQPNAQMVTKWLVKYFYIYIVTAYIPSTCIDKAWWIDKYFPHISSKNIIFCNQKGLLKGHYIIDDAIHNILDFQNTNPCGLPIVFDKPWNRELKNKFVRVKDWLEIKEYFKEWIKIGDII